MFLSQTQMDLNASQLPAFKNAGEIMSGSIRFPEAFAFSVIYARIDDFRTAVREQKAYRLSKSTVATRRVPAGETDAS
jgi:hypothetical protein